MLSYEDSKRLKELGYPQELVEGDLVFWVDIKDYVHGKRVPILCCSCEADYWKWLKDSYVRVPTTDGMIEGLGELFWGINRNCECPDDYDAWEAHGHIHHRSEQTRTIGFGSHPDQALCKLWKKVKR